MIYNYFVSQIKVFNLVPLRNTLRITATCEQRPLFFGLIGGRYRQVYTENKFEFNLFAFYRAVVISLTLFDFTFCLNLSITILSIFQLLCQKLCRSPIFFSKKTFDSDLFPPFSISLKHTYVHKSKHKRGIEEISKEKSYQKKERNMILHHFLGKQKLRKIK